MTAHDPPIRVHAKVAAGRHQHAAAFIFIHGFADEAASLENIAHQFQAANKLPHLEWIFPNALVNRDAMDRAWYMPTRLTPFPSPRPELDDPEDRNGMMQSIAYIETLIEDVHRSGVPLKRTVCGGFSQGCALSLLLNLISKYAGQLAGVVGICGYLPLLDQLDVLRADPSPESKIAQVPIFLARGTRDLLVPSRYFSMCVEKLKALGLSDDLFEIHVYEGMGHSMASPVLRDMCAWLEKIVPSLD